MINIQTCPNTANLEMTKQMWLNANNCLRWTENIMEKGEKYCLSAMSPLQQFFFFFFHFF